MKKIFSLILILVLNLFSLSFAYQIQAGASTKRLSRGQTIELRLVDPITRENVERGDVFTASVTKDITVDNEIILPMGSLVRGTIGSIIPPKRLSKSAVMYLNFDHIVIPNGQQIPIKAGISSNFYITDNGAISGGGNYGEAVKQNWQHTIDITKRATNWGIVSGEQLFTGGKYLLTPFSATVGALGGGIYFVGDSIADLFRKGNDIIINQGKTFDILLLDHLDIPLW